MQAMVLRAAGSPLEPSEIPVRAVTAGQVLLHVESCAVCRTDLHVIDGELRNPKLPLIPGHQIVGSCATSFCRSTQPAASPGRR
jgi:propanol-preferring alcohol dehydrogenase